MAISANLKDSLIKMQHWCAYRDRCISEAVYKLRSLKLGNEEVQTIINKLTEDGFIDEERYCESYVYGKFRSRRWGKYRIRNELRMKGLTEELIERKLALIDDAEYESVLLELMTKKLNELKDENHKMVQLKVIKFVRSKGFETSLSLDTFNKIKINL